MSGSTSLRLLASMVGVLGVRAEEPQLVLRGLDPVRLCEGRQEDGGEGLTVERDGYLYRFVDEASRATFLAEPERYQVQLDGCCARMGALSGRGSPERFVVHEGRLYLFASDSCRSGFLQAPAACLDPDQVPRAADRAAREHGAAWVERAVDFLGGKERLDSWHSYFRERRFGEKSGGQDYARREALLVDFELGVRTESDWGSDYRSATLMSGETSVQIQNGAADVAVFAAGRRQLHRELLREPWFLLRASGEEGFVASEVDVSEQEGRKVARVEVAYSGTVSVLQVDTESGEILSTAYRGLLPDLRYGEVLDRYEGWDDRAGLELPQRIVRSYPGRDLAEKVLDFERVEVDGELPAGWREVGG